MQKKQETKNLPFLSVLENGQKYIPKRQGTRFGRQAEKGSSEANFP